MWTENILSVFVKGLVWTENILCVFKFIRISMDGFNQSVSAWYLVHVINEKKNIIIVYVFALTQ